MSKKIRRVASNTDSDGQSFILSGNLYEVPANVDSFEEENDSNEYDFNFDAESKKVSVDRGSCTLQDYQKANKLCDDIYGVNLIEILVKLLLNDDLKVEEFVIQSLAYKVQSMTRGASGVRYKKSWGMFWAATRNIVRSRGIVAFRDHFSVPSPSQLAKYQHQIIEVCGLKNDNVGRPGIQSKAAELWVNSKMVEAGKEPCLSVSMDAKKIAVTDSGVEDLAGLGSSRTNEEESDVFTKKIETIENLIQQGQRKGLYTALDTLTVTSQQLNNRTAALEQLLVKNNKLLEKNPLLSKYIYVLNNQIVSGQKIINKANAVQSLLLNALAVKRNCSDLRPTDGTLDIFDQKNLIHLPDLTQIDETSNWDFIRNSLSNGLLNINWSILDSLSSHSSKFSRRSETFKHLTRACFLSAETIHASCGFGRSTPLHDMKNAWSRANSVFNISNLPIPLPTCPDLIATFCSSVALMLFGKNAMVHEGGIYIKNGVLAAPDLIVMSSSERLEYTVHMFTSSSNVFEITEEIVVTSLVDSYICGAEKGTIAVLHNEEMCVAFHISSESRLVKKMLSMIGSYIKSQKCISKRSTNLLNEGKAIRGELLKLTQAVTILGSFPIVKHAEKSESSRRSEHECQEFSAASLSDLRCVMQDAKVYLAKKAKELVALNISDLSGNPSKTPHTILGATYLTSTSLKLVGRQCLEEMCSMLTKTGAKVLNVGVDGESLYLASVLPDGSPGTFQALIKHLNDKLKAVKKEKLVELVIYNNEVELKTDFQCENIEEEENVEDRESDAVNIDGITDEVLDSAAVLECGAIEINRYTIEDVEEMLVAENESSSSEYKTRKEIVQSLTLAQLRTLCLKYLIPKAKRVWLTASIGTDSFEIHFDDGETLKYIPNTVFEKIDNSYFRTVSFDYAHIINLLREHAAKGRLHTLGIDQKMLEDLSQQPGYEYLKKIIAIKGNKLVFDSMNQGAAASLFSKKTVEGLETLGHSDAAQCIKIISEGVAALDESGIDVKSRILRINSLKLMLEGKNDMIQRVRRADQKNMTNELLQMVLTTLDSFIYTSMNMEFFNVRRKGTGTVEQLFGQMMMMTDGYGKLDVRQLKDVLRRLSLTSALRLVPQDVRGFKFLSQLRQHMKSYKPDDFEDPEIATGIDYPSLKAINAKILPSNSLFDMVKGPRKKRAYQLKEPVHVESAGANVRKYHKKF